MIISNKIYSPQSYLELVLGKTYIISGDNDVDFIEKILEKYGECLWNYPLKEIDYVLENKLNVVLVDCMIYNQKTHEYEHEPRLFEVNNFEEIKQDNYNKYFFDIKECFIKTVAVEANSLEEAKEKLKENYKLGGININHDYCDYIYFKSVQKEIQKTIDEGVINENELETFK